MRFIPTLLFFYLFIVSTNSYSQENVSVKLPDSLSHWEKKNVVGFDLSEIAFSNWNAGGVSSVSGLLKGNFTRIYSLPKSKWFNELVIRYGINKQDGIAVRKSDDAIQFNSTFGYRKDTISNWYHSAKFNFNTQFTNGYNYPNTQFAISKPFAPAYTFLGVGAEYFNKVKKITVYISPLTMKNTLVLDQRLANQGAFGVVKAIYDLDGNLISEGEKSKTELGLLITSYYKKEVWKNINLENRLSLYSDYINNFGNIDVDWQIQLDLIVNQYVRANIGAHLLYDDDIKAKEEKAGEQIIIGPKIQLKQVLGVGLIYTFK
ncbi:DUF3078 domain-containing protein [Flavobacterium sp.]|uniref:DUF3078 domain-containing protein n=1 Tax=Flavobacterium sp. TaxID=239 RepID=UPI00286CBB9A|nr:DUF3078 domain-containing protein [Flavobacterium sp.]